MKNLNEYFTGYPTAIGNAQSQEYQGVFGPYDAETVQGKDRFNLQTSEGLQRLNSFIRNFFRRATLNPQNDIANLKVRLNHMNLDFPFDNTKPLENEATYVITKGGGAFGTTPTTDLSKGFDTGADLPMYNLNVRIGKSDLGFHIDANLTPHNEITEEMVRKAKRNARIEKIKKIKEDYEVNRQRQIIGGEKARAGKILGTSRVIGMNIAAREAMQRRKANRPEEDNKK